MIDQLAYDIRLAVRGLVRQRAFSLVSILTLALALGATTAAFSVVDRVVLRPLPYGNPGELVKVTGRNWGEDCGGAPEPMTGPVAAAELEAYSASPSFEGFAAYSLTARTVDGASGPERLETALVDPSLFRLLGTPALAGRTFSEQDSMDVAVISERLWERRFGRGAGVVNERLMLDGQPFAIVGVMPDGFRFPYKAGASIAGVAEPSRIDAWLPQPPLRQVSGAFRPGRRFVVARMKPGIAIERAAADLKTIAAGVEAQYRQARPNARVGVRLQPLADSVVGVVKRSLWVLFGAVVLVLLTACANIANLSLTRMSMLRAEIFTRVALGAGRSRLVRQTVLESLLLSVTASAIAGVIAWWAIGLLRALAGPRLPRFEEVGLDWRAFAFLFAAAIAAGLLFAVLSSFGVGPPSLLRSYGGRTTAGSVERRLRDGLMVAEIALAFVLASGATLLVREMDRLQHVDTGMSIDRVLTLHVPPADAAEFAAVDAAIAQVPGVEAVGLTQLVPLQNWGWEAEFFVRGRPPLPGRLTTELRYVTPGYFNALGIRVVRGRPFDEHDTADSRKVIIVNEALARKYFPVEDPIGIQLDRGTIVGLIGNVRVATLDRDAGPEIYYPVAQNVAMVGDLGMTIVARTTGDPASMIGPIREAVARANPRFAIFNVKTMTQVFDDSLWQLRLYRWLVGIFATLALVLAAVGLFGVVSYGAQARTREFAIRAALGSDRGRLARLVLRNGVALGIAGLAGGAIAVFLTSSSLRVLAPGATVDVLTVSLTAAVVVVLTVAASAIPAIRAARVDPAELLRSE